MNSLYSVSSYSSSDNSDIIYFYEDDGYTTKYIEEEFVATLVYYSINYDK